MTRLGLVPLCLVLVGCATTDRSPTAGGMTLATSRVLPGDAIERRIAAADWQIVRDLPVEAYVVFDAFAESNNTVKLRGARNSFPDVTRNDAAKAIATKAPISLNSVGSYLRPRAEVWVIYFSDGPKGRLVLICGKAEGPEPAEGAVVRSLGDYRIERIPTPMSEPAPRLSRYEGSAGTR